MSQAQSQTPAPPWVGTLFHAAVGLALFALLTAGAVVYALQVLAPELLKNQVQLIYERYNTPLPDLANPAMPIWLILWGAAGALCAVAGAVSLWVVIRVHRQVPPWPWVLAGAAVTAGLLLPPLVIGSLAPSVPRAAGGFTWWYITGGFLALGFGYVAWMYTRDGRGVGPLWAVLLGLLRAAVFTLLGFFFMLPAVHDVDVKYSRSKVLVVFDVSGSMVYLKDDVPDEGRPLDALPTRQDKVLAFLANPKYDFLRRLEATNPLDVYRLARSLDPEFLHFSKDNRNWTRAEFDAWLKDPDRDAKVPPPGDLPPEFWAAWLKPGTDVKAADGWNKAQQERFRRFLDLNDDLIQKDADYLNNTNVGDSLLTLVNNEKERKMLQGIIVFTDGRSTEGSPTAFEDLKKAVEPDHIPLFVVAIGEERPKVKLDIVDLRVPPQIQPDDKFPAVVEVTGEGLPDQPVPVELEIIYVHNDKEGKEEPLPIMLRESIDEKPGQTVKRQEAPLPSRIVLRPPEPVKFDTGSPPRAEVQFQIDAATLAAAAGVDLSKQFDKVRKWEIEETLPDSELRFRAHVPRAPKEILAAKEHVSDPAGLVVQKKPLRVLLFASAAMHEYQFVQAIMVRDSTKGRVKVSTFLQPPPGQKEPREGVIQDAQLLTKFPDQFDVGPDKKDDNPYDLSDYDVIVAFDPDWDQLTDKQITLLFGRDEIDANGQPQHHDGWVDKGGGFIYVAGPVNTLQLAGPRADEKKRFGPILDRLPVIPKDIRLEEVKRDTDKAWPLDFKDAPPDTEFLKLEEETAEKPAKFLDDWKDFFGPIQPDKSVNRGFYNFYPVESAKPGAVVMAYFGDPGAKAKDAKSQESLMPYIVVSNPGDLERRLVWVGWGEMWRLRQKNEAYLERFWTKLTRYAGEQHHGKVVKRITTNFGRYFTVGQPIVMEAHIEAKGGELLPEDAKPVVKIKAPLVAPKMSEQDVRTLQGLEGREDLSPADRLLRDQLKRKRDEDEHQNQGLKDLESDKFMTAKPKNPGWFQVRFQAPVEGDYQMEVTVAETGDKVTHKFTVKPSNPELDNTRPDFARMFETASYVDETVQTRMAAADYAELASKLQRPKLEEGSQANQADDRPRLYFNLANADLIPRCMVETEPKKQETYSEPRAIWDEPAPFRWTPWWLAALLSVILTAGFLAGFFLFRTDRPVVRWDDSVGGKVLLGLLALVSLGGFAAGRHLGLAGWLLLAGGLAVLIGPLFLPGTMQLGWYAFTLLIGLMSMEWLVRKLLRLA